MPRKASPPDLTDTALVPVRERRDGWTPRRQREFIERLAETGSVTDAAQTVGMSPASAYRLRARTDAYAFRIAWNAALERAMQQLLPAAIDRALNGRVRERFYHGDKIGEERVFSDRLLVWLLEKGEAMLEGKDLRRAVVRNWDTALNALEAGETAPPPLLFRPDFQIWRCAITNRLSTNCPPPPQFRGWENGPRDASDYRRALTPEEEAALGARLERATGSDETVRRRFFGLPPEPPAP